MRKYDRGSRQNGGLSCTECPGMQGHGGGEATGAAGSSRWELGMAGLERIRVECADWETGGKSRRQVKVDSCLCLVDSG